MRIKREVAIVQADIDDMYFQMMDEWEVRCRSQSSTGENMVRESLMDHGMFEDFKKRVMKRAINKVVRRSEDK